VISRRKGGVKKHQAYHQKHANGQSQRDIQMVNNQSRVPSNSSHSSELSLHFLSQNTVSQESVQSFDADDDKNSEAERSDSHGKPI
jgi:hypothetical protein